jgi:pilus biogenesis lipoprotein CpaD
MRFPIALVAIATAALTSCAPSPVVQQAEVDTRFDPVRGDSMLALAFVPGTTRLDAGQVNELRTMVEGGRRASRDEFLVVIDGAGSSIQSLRAQQVRASLSNAGARWVGTSVEPAMAMGPDQVVVVRSEYRIAERNCPNYTPPGMSNVNEAIMPGYGCANAYNFGQMLARPRDAAIGRDPGPADGTVSAEAIQRYREGRVRTASGGSNSGAGGGGGAAAGGTGGGGGGGGAGGGTGGSTSGAGMGN